MNADDEIDNDGMCLWAFDIDCSTTANNIVSHDYCILFDSGTTKETNKNRMLLLIVV